MTAQAGCYIPDELVLYVFTAHFTSLIDSAMKAGLSEQIFFTLKTKRFKILVSQR